MYKDRHGTYYARVKVPKPLQEAVAQVLGNDKARQVFLKRSLGTKDLRRANVLVKPVLVQLDRIISDAKALLKARPVRNSLSSIEIRRMAEYTYAEALAAHDRFIAEAPEEEADYRKLVEEDEGPHSWTAPIPAFGLSRGQLADIRDNEAAIVAEAEAALGRGDVLYSEHKIDEALSAFQVTLDRSCADFRVLGMEVLRAHVRAIRDMAARHRGEPIPTPALGRPEANHQGGGTLTEALEGWRKDRSPSVGVFSEYERATRLFRELHGEIAVAQITRTHAREFREALQDLPRHRGAALKDAPLPELVEWARKHPDAPRITGTTVNKLLGGVQTVAVWARDNGMVPDDVRWADPFARMRLEREEPEREAFTLEELNALFASPVFRDGERPAPGAAEAAYWLPLVALFTGARRAEIAGLTVADVHTVQDVHVFAFRADRDTGKTLKTRSSARTVPVHPQLIERGWLQYVSSVSRSGGTHAWLFPEIAPSAPSKLKAWTKWFHRYMRANGVPDPRKVFHSFRHTFKDALRAARTPEDLSDALTGHSNPTVGRGYGAKHIVHRYGIETLKDAIERVNYKGLKLPREFGRPSKSKRKRS
ncbi:MAG TPA: site-specific integrase [Pseudolabrys sp.]|uniref:site-specific integrase n=1 Tax=Pseudolabrys sp. TaxID=1960880 RepID=UPI002DDD5C35|nr:site-specific integrase [Pseudolabrys sp.]HEV2631323.1 site-specific integrase [Pseudolabrys sp.]